MEYIRLEHITKIFGSVVANDDISLSIDEGEVLSILGENGSGKTTLLNVLDGIYRQDEGKIFIHGEEVSISSPRDAYRLGIGMVHQHFKLIDAFTAIENVVLGLSKKELLAIYDRITPPGENGKKGYRRASLKESAAAAKAMCDKYGFVFSPYKLVSDMGVAEKQTLEIVKALFRGVDTLILDEPTAVLTPQEANRLFEVVQNMKKNGKTVIIITHKLNEVLEVSDRVAIFRKGKLIDILETEKANESMLAEAMVGSHMDLNIPRTDIENTGPRLVVSHLTIKNREGREVVSDVSFTLNGCEILGIAGVSGSGQKELMEALSGLNRDHSGTIIFHNPKKNRPVTFFHKNVKQVRELAKQGKFYFDFGSREQVNFDGYSDKQIEELVEDRKVLFYENEIIDISHMTPLQIRNYGIKLSFVPEDRLGMGLIGGMSVIDNMLLRSYRKGKGRILDKARSRALAEEVVKKLDIQTPSTSTEVKKLSGGNIQKVLIGREISSRPKIMMVAYPVRGLDINSSYLIYKLLDEQKTKNTGIIYVGEDLDALLAITDRIMVLCDGKVTGIVDSRTTTKEEIGLLMSKSN